MAPRADSPNLNLIVKEQPDDWSLIIGHLELSLRFEMIAIVRVDGSDND